MSFTRRYLHYAVLTTLYLLTASRCALAQTLLKAADLQTDVAILRRTYETLHPGLYRYNTRSEMDRLFETLAHDLNHDQSRESAYRTISVFLARIKCGHTYANFYNQRKGVTEELLMRGGRVPFYFRWIDNRMIVTRSFTPGIPLPPGTEILSINNAPVKEILTQLLTIARADGNNQNKRISYLQVQGNDRFEAFDIYFPLFYPMRGNTMALRIVRPGENPTVVSVPSLTQAERQKQVDADAATGKDSPGVPWTTRTINNQVVILTMPTWALYGNDTAWRAYLNSFFDRIIAERIPHLVIDLRQNEGGVSVGNAILSRLVERALPLPQFQRYVRSRAVPKDLNRYLDTWDDSFRDWGGAAVEPPLSGSDPVMQGLYRLTRFDDAPGADIIYPAGKRYTGKVYVLVGATNSSATFEFAQALHESKLGTLAGQTTGGNQRGINGGAFFFLMLPQSGIEVDVPLVGLFPAGGKHPDQGIPPDISVSPRIQDIADATDAELASVLRRIGL